MVPVSGFTVLPKVVQLGSLLVIESFHVIWNLSISQLGFPFVDKRISRIFKLYRTVFFSGGG